MSLIPIDARTNSNSDYRKIVLTTGQLQVVIMNLKPGQSIPTEVHYASSQFIKIESGSIIAIVDDKIYHVSEGESLVVPAGARHEIDTEDGAKLYTIYSPPVHTVIGGYKAE